MPRALPRQRPHLSEQTVETPDVFMNAVRSVWGEIDFDVCATAENAKAGRYYTVEDDALSVVWRGLGLAWCNPPYGDIGRFVVRAIEGVEHGTRTLMLAPASTGARWFRAATERADCYFLSPRITFVGHRHAYPKDLVLLDFWVLGGGKFRAWVWQP